MGLENGIWDLKNKIFSYEKNINLKILKNPLTIQLYEIQSTASSTDDNRHRYFQGTLKVTGRRDLLVYLFFFVISLISYCAWCVSVLE